MPRTGSGCRTGSVSTPRGRRSGGTWPRRCAAPWITGLTARQRQVFVAIVLNGVPLDALVLELGSNRNAIYKVLFDARRKLRSVLAANGYLPDDSPGNS